MPTPTRINPPQVADAKPKLKKPRLYKVVLVNDDYTPMEFVVNILQQIFDMHEQQAITVMLLVHQRGRGVCGLYPREIAEMKVRDVLEIARLEGHPLQCMMEPE